MLQIYQQIRQLLTVPATDFLGFTFAVDAANKGNDLNGYSIQIKKSTGTPTVNIDTGNKAIVISGDVSTIGCNRGNNIS